MKIGTLINISSTETIDEKFSTVNGFGLASCQVCIWNQTLYTQEVADAIIAASKKYEVEISTFWAGWSGPASWNFYEGQYDLGLVPDEYRIRRFEDLMRAAEFAKKLGVKNMATHVGFMPENPADERYIKTIYVLKVLCQKLKNYGINFLFETGQETPVTLLRAIEDIGTGNIGINLDTGNLILYGKASPVDALDMIGKYVMDLHIKDGLYPTDGKNLGKEVPAGEGKVNFPVFLPKLKALGYDGSITIEREITGEKQREDILNAKRIIEKYWV